MVGLTVTPVRPQDAAAQEVTTPTEQEATTAEETTTTSDATTTTQGEATPPTDAATASGESNELNGEIMATQLESGEEGPPVEVGTDAEDDDLPVETPEETLDWMADEYVAEFGVSKPEAKRRLQRQKPLSEEIARLVELEGSRVAGWGFDHGAEYRGYVWLKGNRPGSSQGVAMANGIADLELRVGARHSFEELKEAYAELFSSKVPGQPLSDETLASVTSSAIDLENNTIKISVEPGERKLIEADKRRHQQKNKKPKAKQPKSDAIGQGAIGQGEPSLSQAEVQDDTWTSVGVSVVIKEETGPTELRTLHGGDKMRNSRGVEVCTSGFSSRLGLYRIGFITAAHCGDPLSQAGVDLGTSSRWRKYDSHGDVQFHDLRGSDSINHRAKARFRCGTFSYCDVTGTETQARMMNEIVCHNGIRTGRSCGRVTENFFTPEYPICSVDDCAPAWVKIEGNNLRICPGDSGGPVFSGTIAYGIITGGQWGTGGCRRDLEFGVFYPMNLVDRYIPDHKVRLTHETTRPLSLARLPYGSHINCLPLALDNIPVHTLATIGGFEPGEYVEMRIFMLSGRRVFGSTRWESAGGANSQGRMNWREVVPACFDGVANVEFRGGYTGRWIRIRISHGL